MVVAKEEEKHIKKFIRKAVVSLFVILLVVAQISAFAVTAEGCSQKEKTGEMGSYITDSPKPTTSSSQTDGANPYSLLWIYMASIIGILVIVAVIVGAYRVAQVCRKK